MATAASSRPASRCLRERTFILNPLSVCAERRTQAGKWHTLNGWTMAQYSGAAELKVAQLTHIHADAVDEPIAEWRRALILPADAVGTVVSDAQPFPAEHKVAGLRPHRPFRNQHVI